MNIAMTSETMISEMQPQVLQSDSHLPTESELAVPAVAVLRGPALLRQLRDHVQVLVKELDRLQVKNQKLTERIAELESSGMQNLASTNLTFEENREQLLTRINSFIEAIDSYLATEQEETDQ